MTIKTSSYELRLASCLHVAVGSDFSKWVQASDAFTMATLEGSAAVEQEEILGEIEPGFKADLVLLDANSAAIVPLKDPAKNSVFTEYGQSDRTVLVDGKVVVEDGCLITVDQEEILQEVREHAFRYFADNEERFRILNNFLPSGKHTGELKSTLVPIPLYIWLRATIFIGVETGFLICSVTCVLQYWAPSSSNKGLRGYNGRVSI